MQEIKISVSQTRNYGDVSQTYSVESTFIVDNANDRKKRYQQLNVLIAEEFEAFEASFLPKHTSDAESEGFEDPTLEYRKEGDREFYRIKVGKWAKWGVPIYSEVLPEPLAVQAKEAGSILLTGYRGTIELSDGKPKRVSSLWRVSQ